MPKCEHKNFKASVVVNRLEDVGEFAADITICCADCGEPFRFLGLPMGLDFNGATVDPDGNELRVAILPNSQCMSPLEQMLSSGPIKPDWRKDN